nr:CHAT domain-containing protein [Rhodohalobacter sp. SW132]
MINDHTLGLLGEARAYSGIARFESTAGNYNKSVEYYTKSLSLAEKIDDIEESGRLLINAHNNVGISYRRIGDYNLAMEHYRLSIDLIKELHGDDHLEMGKAYNNIGTIYYMMQDFGQAAEYFGRSAGIIESIFGPNDGEMGAILNNAALCYYSIGNYELAAEYLERAQRVKEENFGPDHMETAIGYSNLASIHIQNEDYKSAEENYLRSISVRKNIYGDDHPHLISPKLFLGRLYAYHTNENERAREQYTRAIAIGEARLGENNPTMADAHYLKGETYQISGNYDRALELYQKAVNMLYGDYTLTGLPDTERPMGDPVKIVEVLQSKSLLYRTRSDEFKRDDYEMSLRALEWASALVDMLQQSYKNEASKLRLVDHNYSIYTGAIETLAELYFELGDPEYKNEIFNYIEKSRARVALELIQDISAMTIGGVPDEIIKLESELNRDITSVQQQIFNEREAEGNAGSEFINALQDSLFTKKRELEKFTRQLEQDYPEYYRLKYDQSVLSVDQLQGLLQDGETVVSYVLGLSNMYAMVISESEIHVVDLGMTEDAAPYIEGARDIITKGTTEEYIYTSHTLYKKLIEPVEPYLNGTNVMIMADQELHYLPFEVLLTDLPDHQEYHNMPYLLKDYTISYIPSGTMLDIMQQRRPENPRNLLAVAPFNSEIIRPESDEVEVQYASTLEPLLLTNYETSTISGLFSERRTWMEYLRPQQTKILAGEEATLNRFSQVNLKNYNFVHFATHAFVNEDYPEFSGIMMYPEAEGAGIAYVGDIYNMEFNADLVVLGACETGLGTTFRGEGLIGFTRAFIYAGASNLMVSMWKVNDQPTAYLMIDFYDHIRNGYSYNEALRQAKLNLISRPHMADPVNWAAFILQGR